MQSNRCVGKKYYCYQCQKNVHILVHIDDPTPTINCPECQSGFCEEIIEPALNIHAQPKHPYKKAQKAKQSVKRERNRSIQPNIRPALNRQPKLNTHTHKRNVPKAPLPKQSVPNIPRPKHPQPKKQAKVKLSPPVVMHNRHHSIERSNEPFPIYGNVNIALDIMDRINPIFQHHVVSNNFGDGLNLFEFFSQNIFSMLTDIDQFRENFVANFRGFDPHISIIIQEEMNNPGNQNPINSNLLSKLPRFNLEEKHCKKGQDGEMEKPTCSICCDQMKLGDYSLLLPCGHMYHDECMKPWLSQHNTCPLCRNEIK